MAYLAKIPYAAGDRSYKNDSIQEYNRVLTELGFLSPDFYDWFETHLDELGEDDFHPNGIGYESMADLWFKALP